MSQDIVFLVKVELTGAYLQVARIENVHVQWLPRKNQHPLSKVEFAASKLLVQEQRCLDILLHDGLLALLGQDLLEAT
jgi:hypothetical protein